MAGFVRIMAVFVVFMGLIPCIVLTGGRNSPEEEPAYTEEQIVRALAAQVPADHPKEAIRAQAVLVRTCFEGGYTVEGLTDGQLRELYGEDWEAQLGVLERAVYETPFVLEYGDRPARVFWHPYNSGMTQPGDGPYLKAVSSPETDMEPGEWDCVGLSQIGAKLMAEQGSSYEEILAHYFPGTELVKSEK